MADNGVTLLRNACLWFVKSVITTFVAGYLNIYIYIYITRVVSNKIHREVGWAKNFSAPRVQYMERAWICELGSAGHCCCASSKYKLLM